MIKNLIAVAMASILITQPPQNTNDGTYYQDVEITESYEYQTNEVNSVNDLVVGNIYKANIDLETITKNNALIRLSFFAFFSSNEINIKYNNLLENTQLYIGLYSNDNANYRFIIGNANGNNSYDYIPIYTSETNINFYFVFTSLTSYSNELTYSASDYLGEKTITVEPVETEGLYNLAYHFLYSRIYTNTELQSMETTLFGTTINMNMWLAHTTAIVIICLLLIVLIKFVIWLFKIVSGGMLWK